MATFSWLHWVGNDLVQAAADEGRWQADGLCSGCANAISHE